MSTRAQRAKAHDPTVYPEEERVGEELLQRWIVELLRPLLERWLAERGVVALVGADQFIYYRQYDAHKRFAPDIYVLPGVAPTTRVRVWKTWQTGILPSLALEVASTDWEKDYFEVPERCDEAGVGELIVFDPSWTERPGGVGARWQVFRRTKTRGLRRIETTDEDRVRSRALGCWLRSVGGGDGVRVRIGVGSRGDQLVPTSEEREQAERAAKEVERAAKEAERAAKEVERAAKEAALGRVAELEAELSALRRGRKKRR